MWASANSLPGEGALTRHANRENLRERFSAVQDMYVISKVLLT